MAEIFGRSGRVAAALFVGLIGACAAPADDTTPEPDDTVVDTAQPDTAQPDTTQSDTAKLDTDQPDAAQPDAAQLDTTQSDTAKLDTAQPDTAQLDTVQPDAGPVDAGCKTNADCPIAQGQCKLNICQPGGSCAAGNKTAGTGCDDGDACTLGDECGSGICKAGAAKNCDDGKACSKDTCAPKDGACSNVPDDDKACDDGQPCTGNDACKDGKCAPGKAICACESDADCPDDNACDGKLFCDLASHSCKNNVAVAVNCYAGDDTACLVNLCAAKSGKCAPTPVANGKSCEDGKTNTVGDACNAGKCESGTKVGCTNDNDCVAEDDGDLCNGTLFCNKAKNPPACQFNPATPVHCNTVQDTPCRTNECRKELGKCRMKDAPTGKPCTDGNNCTGDDACAAGKCAAKLNTCECEQTADCAVQDEKDANRCNGTLFCNKGLAKPKCEVNPLTIVRCPTTDNTPCVHSTCKPQTGKCIPTAVNDNGPCDADGNACTPSDTCKAGACEADENVCACANNGDCAAKEDGDLCNGTLFCDKSKVPFVCKVNAATIPNCSDDKDTECAYNVCLPKSGGCALISRFQGSQCDADGNPCTPHDWCHLGACTADVNICACASTGDCGKFEDGDLCNGTLYCDKQKQPFGCAINPASQVTCTEHGHPCLQNECVAQTGKCIEGERNQGHLCDDDKGCTDLDACDRGKCVGEALICNDGNACTNDTCDAAKQKCVYLPIDVTSTCTDGKPCTKDYCDTDVGCVHEVFPEGAVCAKGDACRGPARCEAGKCAQGPLNTCGDGDGCTVDDCDTDTGCTYTPAKDDLDCSDGNKCKPKACKSGKCSALAPLKCDDSNLCTADSCDEEKGCVYTPWPFEVPCTDGKPCTAGDVCKTGTCTGGPARKCDDGNPCTQASCDNNVKDGCVFKALADGNACGNGDKCQPTACKVGKCAPLAKPDCKANGPCDLSRCDSAKGCVHENKADTTACDDGSQCTVGDGCKDGKCASGKPASCDDDNVCTKDSCDPAAGCTRTNTAEDGTCDDNSACTEKDSCKAGKCVGAARVCDDKEACTTDACDVAKGCTFTARSGSCDDGSKCTTLDQCDAGKCAGKPKDCADVDACTTDACDAETGACSNKPKSCDDANSCTDDKCQGSTGKCGNFENAASCDDGNFCSLSDACDGGSCVAGPARVCDDKNACTRDSCDVKNKKCVFVQHDDPCSDGNACTRDDVCKDGKCAGTLKICKDSDVCTSDGCDAKTGDCVFPDAANGTKCDGDRACHAGICRWAVSASLGNRHACVLKADQSVACWGYNNNGQVGNGKTADHPAVPQAVDGLGKVVQLSVAADRSCVRQIDDSIRCWGHNASYSRLGTKTQGSVVKPEPMTMVAKAKWLHLGPANACWIDDKDIASCIGDNINKQLGNAAGPLIPASPFGFMKVKWLRIGTDASCAVDMLDRVWCLGRQQYGSTASGSLLPYHQIEPVLVRGFGSVVAGVMLDRGTCFLAATGVLRCAGQVNNGKLGIAVSSASAGLPFPVAVDTLARFVAVAIGHKEHGCAIDDQHKLHCWGNSPLGQVGTNKQYDQVHSPVRLDAMGTVQQVAVGNENTCAVNDLGEVRCIGGNTYGQLGRGVKSAWEGTPALVKGSDALAGQVCKTTANKCDDANACTLDVCDLATGKCSHAPATDGTSCATGLVCAAGACKVPFAHSVSAGGGFTCARRPLGDVHCWGSNSYGELGNGQGGTGKTDSTPSAVTGLIAQTISAGQRHACGLLADGTPRCWGDNGAGQANPGGGATVLTPAAVTGAGKYVAIAAGSGFTCAVDAAGKVFCWGANTHAQLGRGTASAKEGVGAVTNVAGATGIAAGSRHACAWNAAGDGWCWGDNVYGQLGNGKSFEQKVAPGVVVGLSGIAWIAAADRHTCARTTVGLLHCWGGGEQGRLGNGAKLDSKLAVLVKKLTAVVDVRAAGGSTCATTDDGKAWCWGVGGKGQLGNGADSDSPVPVEVSGIAGVRSLAVGAAHACAVTGDGATSCWGSNDTSQLGRDGVTASNKPQAAQQTAALPDLCAKNNVKCDDNDACTDNICNPASGKCSYRTSADSAACGKGRVCVAGACRVVGATRLWAGGYTACIRGPNDRLSCWGAGKQGELGTGNKADTGTPTTTTLAVIAPVHVALIAGRSWAADGSFNGVGWGTNPSTNPLGTGTGDVAAPAKVTAVRNARLFAAGDTHTCALTRDREVKCWGANTPKGELGANTDDAAGQGVLVPLVSGSTAIAAGTNHTCALLGNGTVRCWGAGSSGQLGDGTKQTTGDPLLVANVSSAKLLTAAGDGACAVVAGDAWCWGAGAAKPLQISGPSAITAIAAGAGQTCAVSVDRSVWCWAAGKTTASKIGGLTAAAEVAVGEDFACVRGVLGAVYCWGKNDRGQLGNGKVEPGGSTATPTLVVGTAHLADKCQGKTCDDGKPCTLDSCDAATGSCAYAPAPEGFACGGDNACISGVCSWARDITVGNTFGCVAHGSGRVSCWGYNNRWILGVESKDLNRSAKPVIVQGVANVRSLAAGNDHVCALIDDGSISCWGSNAHGLAGHGGNFPTTFARPQQVIGLPSPAVQVLSANKHSCAVVQDGTTWCWGDGDLSRFGFPSYITTVALPYKTPTPADVAFRFVGDGNTGYLTAAGDLHMVGSNNTWQLGYQQSCCSAKSPTYVKIPKVANASHASMRDRHACVVHDGGKASCWGAPPNGKHLGDGQTVKSENPVPVQGITDAVSVHTGFAYTCFIMKDRTMQCFGYNQSGQLGNGNTTHQLFPVPVQGLKGVRVAAVGQINACALTDDGKAWCWGQNDLGSVGKGQFTYSESTPQLLFGQ